MEENKKTTFEREEFKDYIYTDFDEENIPDERLQEDTNAVLYITSLSFENKNKWRFIYNGFPISILVKDSVLMQEIDNGARFGKGDTLSVRLRIVQKYDKSIHTYVNSSYKIMEYYKHTASMQQQTLPY